jgi:hypothetical protein
MVSLMISTVLLRRDGRDILKRDVTIAPVIAAMTFA